VASAELQDKAHLRLIAGNDRREAPQVLYRSFVKTFRPRLKVLPWGDAGVAYRGYAVDAPREGVTPGKFRGHRAGYRAVEDLRAVSRAWMPKACSEPPRARKVTEPRRSKSLLKATQPHASRACGCWCIGWISFQFHWNGAAGQRYFSEAENASRAWSFEVEALCASADDVNQALFKWSRPWFTVQADPAWTDQGL